MDARPQRPVRAVRVHGDENAASQAIQTLHQRHKSMGTLANMQSIGGMKAAAKRTAFGDVSNIAKGVTARDDSAIAVKSVIQDIIKPTAVPAEKSSAFLRPAQRPMNPAGPKVHLSSSSNSASVEHVPAHIPLDSKVHITQTQQIQLQTQGTKKMLQRRATTIFKDEGIKVEVSTIKEDFVSTAPAHQKLGPRHHKSQPQLNTEQQPILRKTQSKYMDAKSGSSVETISTVSVKDEEDEEVKNTESCDEAYELYVDALNGKEEEVDQEEYELQEASDSVEPEALEEKHHRQSGPTQPTSEPEEYWEEEEEIYDDQGYTTAHSTRSRGDNTTGGATTVLFPKITNKARRELAEAKEIVESSRTMDEIEDEAWDTSMVAEYGDEIFAYMRELEFKMLPNPHYMDNQTEIQWSMRSVLMDWLVQVHHRFSLLPETLFLCVNYIDRFLSCKIVSLGKLQLVGATAIFVAAKYEEINCPSVNEIVYMVDNGYTADEILKAERFMLSMLQFELGWPGPMSFLRRISKADDYDLETRTLAKYFLEVTIMDERFVGSPPSYVAAGAHCLSRFMLKKGDWSPAHKYYSGYTWSQLRPLVALMLECCENPQKHHAAVFEKYEDRRYKRASTFVQTELRRGFTLPPLQPSIPRSVLSSFDDVVAQMQYENRESLKRLVQIKG
ncbi:cyclin-like protein [Xylogone sp. PMI_703]|nr:cyclin-like protein [Xylogone sp. PMI_703]